MGKRKKSSRKPMGPKKSDPLPSTFTCLFCNHEKSVSVKLDRKAGVGQLDCRICGQKFQCAVNSVDVYGEWVDAADAVAKEDTTNRYEGSARTPKLLKRSQNDRHAGTDEEGGEGVFADDDDFQ